MQFLLVCRRPIKGHLQLEAGRFWTNPLLGARNGKMGMEFCLYAVDLEKFLAQPPLSMPEPSLSEHLPSTPVRSTPVRAPCPSPEISLCNLPCPSVLQAYSLSESCPCPSSPSARCPRLSALSSIPCPIAQARASALSERIAPAPGPVRAPASARVLARSAPSPKISLSEHQNASLSKHCPTHQQLQVQAPPVPESSMAEGRKEP